MARKSSCPSCKRLRAQVRALQAQIDSLRATVVELQERLASTRKDSSTSSKPPSSDLVKPLPAPPPEGQAKRSIGGQPGHPRHERPMVGPELLNGAPHTYVAEICPQCGHGLEPSPVAPRVVQQIDIETIPIRIEEHRARAGWCPHCRKLHYAVLPSGIDKGGLVGPRLTTLIAYLKGACHASYSTIRKFLRDVVRITLSRGLLQKVIGKVSEALEGPYEELLEALPGQARLNVDETGHKDNGALLWTWCFRAELYTLFKIDPHRRADVLLDVLGEEFDGVLGCDCFSAYRRYMRECDVVVQFCLAHLIRDIKFLTTLPGTHDRGYGERLREALRQLFRLIHCREQMPTRQFQAQLEAARDTVLVAGTTSVPSSRQCAGRPARSRECKSHTGKAQPAIPTPSHALAV